MQLVCGKCQRSLSELAEGVRYCPYCGSRISTIPDGHEAPTGTYEFDDLSSAGTDSGLMPIGNGRTRGQMPDEIGPFKLLKVLGSGAMGTVFEAIHKETQQPAAVKLLDPRLVDNAVSVERFRQEGRLASQINHPHSVFVFIADADAGWPYIAMELMPGNTLKTLIDEEGPLEPLRAVRLAIEIVDGLNEAHRNGVIHRDVKPSNCFLTADGHVKVGVILDFPRRLAPALMLAKKG
ncbi:MAG: protein kinase [Zavarzinella sp.]